MEERYGPVTNRPGKTYVTGTELTRQQQAADSPAPKPPTCSVCESKLAQVKEFGPLICVLCQAREGRRAGKNSKLAQDAELLAYTSRDGEHILVSPLGNFVVEQEAPTEMLQYDVPEPAVVDEDMYMPTDRQPGSLDKLDEMRARYVAGLPVFHSEDDGAWNADALNGRAALDDTERQQEMPDKDDEAAGSLWDLAKELTAQGVDKTRKRRELTEV